LISQGSGTNSGCWTGKIAASLKSTGFPSVCIGKTLNMTLCCDVHGNMLLTVDCGGAGSGQATLPGPVGCNPLDVTFTNVSLPADCTVLEGSLPNVEITGSVLG
jgi:hypothetical protein